MCNKQLVLGNWPLVIGNWKKVIDNRQLVIGQNGCSRQSGGSLQYKWFGMVWFGRGRGGMFRNVLEYSRMFWKTPKGFLLVVVQSNYRVRVDLEMVWTQV